MEWRGTDFDWNHARALLAVAEEGSLSAAARALGQSQPTLGRQVAALEEALGVVLFQRVGNRLNLTETALDLVEQVRAMRDAAGRFALIAAGNAEGLDGLVRISASEVVSAFLLPPIVAELRALHPGIEVELVVSNATSDLRRREADIAVRHFRPRGDDLIARLVKEANVAHLYATPGYLARIGDPETPEALAAAGQVIGFDDGTALEAALASLGLSFTRAAFGVRTESQLVQWALAKQGVGMCVMMDEVGDADPAVRRVLPELPGLVFPTWLTTHRELKTSRRIRAVFEHLAARLHAGVAP